MLLQSWGDDIRVFPAVPSAWEEAAFHDLRAEGAFLVSAVRSGGTTAWIRVQSLAGQPCRLRTDMTGDVRIAGSDAAGFRALGGGAYELELPQGGEAVLYRADYAGSDGDGSNAWEIAPVPSEEHLCGYFGGRKPWRLYGLPIR
jgi:hypothetical protein